MPITITDYTTGIVDGSGAFDEMMKAVKAHVVSEYNNQRIQGTEYANVYLGSLQSVMGYALEFLLKKDLQDLEAQKLTAEIALINAEKLKVDAQTALAQQQEANLLAEAANIPKEGLVLDAQKCKLDAEYDVLLEQKLKVIAETALLTQKKVTEQAQTSGTGIDAASVVGKQIALYTAQTDGFTRDAEQKAAKLMIGSWEARRMTDELTTGNETNNLDDANIGNVVSQLLTGAGVTPV